MMPGGRYLEEILSDMLEHCGRGASLKFRRAVEEDIPLLVRLFKETMVDVYGQILPKETLQPWVEGDRLHEDVSKLWPHIILAESGGDAAAAAARLGDLIALLWVRPAKQRMGIGSALLNILETDLRRSGFKAGRLECFSDNIKAIRFYRAKGWQIQSEEMDPGAGVLKMVMTKPLVAVEQVAASKGAGDFEE